MSRPSQQDLRVRATDLAFSLLREAGFEAPPFNPYSVAARRRLYVVEVDGLGEESARLLPGDPPVVELNAGHPPTRRCFWLAYSLLRHLLPLEAEGEKQRHRIWMAGATELMMPEEWFREVGALSDWDLFVLRHDFAFSSHEAIARRITALTPAVATVFDNGAMTRRFATPGVEAPPQPTRLELEAYARAAKQGPGSYEIQAGELLCRAYSIRPRRSDWQRIIVVLLGSEPAG